MQWYEKFRQFWIRTLITLRRTAIITTITTTTIATVVYVISPTGSFSASSVSSLASLRIVINRSRIFREASEARKRDTDMNERRRTSAVNRAKTLRQIKKYGSGPTFYTLAQNYTSDFFPVIPPSSAMRHHRLNYSRRKSRPFSPLRRVRRFRSFSLSSALSVLARAKWHTECLESRPAAPALSSQLSFFRLLEARIFPHILAH